MSINGYLQASNLLMMFLAEPFAPPESCEVGRGGGFGCQALLALAAGGGDAAAAGDDSEMGGGGGGDGGYCLGRRVHQHLGQFEHCLHLLILVVGHHQGGRMAQTPESLNSEGGGGGRG